jgi:hypothetical protein
MNPQCSPFKTDQSTSVLGQADAAVFHLPWAGFMPELSDDLMDLTQTRCTQGMPPGFQATGGIDG